MLTIPVVIVLMLLVRRRGQLQTRVDAAASSSSGTRAISRLLGLDVFASARAWCRTQ